GALACACCGGGSRRAPSLEPQPEVPHVEQTPQTAPAPPKTPAAQAQQTPQPTPTSQPPQMVQVDKAQSTSKSLAPSSRADTGRTRSLPSTSQMPASAPAQDRERHKTLPSKPPAQKASASPSDFPPILEVPTEHGRGTLRNSAFPPSVHITGGNRKAPSGPPPVKAPFMQD
ncbi:hypothetical protein FRC11_009586, partial [Ceratobasidium sp. 423]